MIQFTNKRLNILLSILLLTAFGISGLAQGQGRGGMGMGGNQPQDMQTIHALFGDHQKISRTVKNIENGLEAVTESDDPKVQALIKEHTWAMKARLKNHQPIRQWDPLFAALFEHADKINLEVTNTAKGVKVRETSADPYVVKLIQSHAASISEHVKEGPSSMHKRHELPDARPKAETKFLGKGDGVTTCPVTGEPVNQNISAEIFGRTVYFCCPSCRDTVLKNPALYLKPGNAEATMKVMKLQTLIGKGKDKQVDTLFEGPQRKVQQITLRNRAVLSAHKAAEPITIQCVAGKGTIQLGEKGETVELRPGVLLTLEPNITHEVKALPAVSILLTRFTGK